MMHGATMVVLQSSSLSSIRLVQQADCQRGRSGNVLSDQNVNVAVVGATVTTHLATDVESERKQGPVHNSMG